MTSELLFSRRTFAGTRFAERSTGNYIDLDQGNEYLEASGLDVKKAITKFMFSVARSSNLEISVSLWLYSKYDYTIDIKTLFC